MLIHKILLSGADILLIIFAIYLLFYYFDIFFKKRKSKVTGILGGAVFLVWQIIISKSSVLTGYLNISIAIIVTLVAVIIVYEGGSLNKCIFVLAFNAMWMLIETLSGYVLLIYFNQFIYPRVFDIVGSLISKLLFLFLISALKKVFSNDEIKGLSAKYSIMFVLIPTGSIYIMNNMFQLSYKINSDRINFQFAVASIILLGINILIFYIYLKLADDLRLRRMTSIYEQQLELCERHQQEREISTLHLRDIRHNMKNNLVTILAYAENEDCKKIIHFVNEIMEEGGISISAITNSGNIVIDSLIGYWSVAAKKADIDLTANISIPMKIPVKGADICLILGNLLENAVEAAEKVDEDKYIKIQMKYDKNNLLLYIVNSYNGRLIKTKDNKLKTTKSDTENHGVGLASVYRAVSKYQGSIIIDDSISGRFAVRVVLYGEQA